MIQLYNADNMVIMPTLQAESIQLIYCDILFNTGNTFTDYKDTIDDIDAFYLPRFTQMHRLLKDTGLLYIHVDYNESHYIKILLDRVFGRDQFRNEIIWYFNSAPRKKKDFGKRHNTIFRYSKTDAYYFNAETVRVPYALSAPRGYAKEKYYNTHGKVMDDVWIINALGQNDKTERVNYSTQKPIALVEPIVLSSSQPDDIIADFFLGSGTMAIVALKHNRNFIGIDISEKSINITQERIKQYD